jgi:hypothetical protein
MTKVFVLHAAWLTPQLLEMLQRLLAELGFQLLLLKAVGDEEELSEIAPEDLLLVLIDDAIDQDDLACRTIGKAAAKGVTIVGVWPPGRSDPTLPSVLQRSTAGGLVTCEKDALGALLRGPAGETWLQPDGQSRPKQDIKRGGCG